MTKQLETTSKSRERILLVIVDLKRRDNHWTTDDVLQEMTELAVACNGEVIDSVVCRVDRPSASTLISDGKVQDVASLCEMKKIETCIFSHELKGSQQRNLEDRIGARTIDRTQLILDIFARRATSGEGKMQVELAQLEYTLPRLVGHGAEMSRQGGGIGTVGPGETKLEVDRRRIGERISKLKKNLKDVAADRGLKRKKRHERGIPLISLVGYTNAGKSTLLNTLTGAGQVTKDGLFTTLDSLSRKLALPNHQQVIISDTVGFMHELPHKLIEAFKATLEEVQESDLLLHVIDVSHPNYRNFNDAVLAVLQDLEIKDKPIITVLNKIDKLDDTKWLSNLKDNFANAVTISALKGQNIDKLLEEISGFVSSMIIEVNVDVPIGRMDLVNLAHEKGEVYSIKYYADTINIRASIPAYLEKKFKV